MPSAILHFGKEIDECFPQFRRHGYTIHCFQSAIDFREIGQTSTDYDLVSSADSEDKECLLAADHTRKSLLVPAVLFRTRVATPVFPAIDSSAMVDTSDYDLVIPTDAPTKVWIPRLDALISLGRRLRDASRRIVANSARLRQDAITERAHQEIGRANWLCEQIDVSRRIPNLLADRILKCTSCGTNFVFPAGEQLLMHFRDGMNVPLVCDECKRD